MLQAGNSMIEIGDIKVLEQTGPKTYTTFGTGISPKSYRGFADYLEAYLKSIKYMMKYMADK